MCVHGMHASADSFVVGSGVWSVFVMFSLAYFGTQSRILFPAKRYFEGLTAKYFSRENVCVYGKFNIVPRPIIRGRKFRRLAQDQRIRVLVIPDHVISTCSPVYLMPCSH
jgi:hypothetical protein